MTATITPLGVVPQTLDALETWLDREPRETVYQPRVTCECVLARYFQAKTGIEDIKVSIGHVYYIDSETQVQYTVPLTPAFIMVRALFDHRYTDNPNRLATPYDVASQVVYEIKMVMRFMTAELRG